MTTRAPRFSAIPNIPQSGLSDWQFLVLNAMKENVELLSGTRGAGGALRAVTSGQVRVPPVGPQTMQRVSATGSGFVVSGVSVAGLEEFTQLAGDVQRLAEDVANIRATLNTLINQLKG